MKRKQLIFIMENLFSWFCVTIIFLLFWSPSMILAQPSNINFNADNVILLPDRNFEAFGNVEVYYQGQTLKADRIIYNSKTNTIDVKKLENFRTGSGMSISAKEGEIDEDLKNGIISIVNIIIDEKIRLSAHKVTLSNGEINKIDNISRLTSCDECEDAQPLWHFDAKSARRDIKSSNIIYKGVSLRIKGFLVAYAPYIVLPDPSTERARGFLIPSLAVSSSLGSGLKLPFFIPIGRDKDILLTPYISSETTTIQYRYRQSFNKGSLNISGAMSSDNLQPQDLRSFMKVQGDFKFSYDLGLTLDAGYVSDDFYMGDYTFGEESTIDTNAILSKTSVGTEHFLDGRLTLNRSVTEGGLVNKYFEASGEYVKNLNATKFPGNFDLIGSVNTAGNFDDKNKFSRPASLIKLGLNYRNRMILDNFEIVGAGYALGNSFVNPANEDNFDNEVSILHGFAINLSIPFVKKQKSYVHSLKPKIHLAYNKQDNLISGSHFLGVDEINAGNIFSQRKVNSLSESEQGLTISAGISQSVNWSSGYKFNVFMGLTKLDEVTYTPQYLSSITSDKFSYLSTFLFESPKSLKFSGQALFLQDEELLSAKVNSGYSFGSLIFNADYEYLNGDTDARIQSDIENAILDTSYKFSATNSFSVAARYDLNENAMSEIMYGTEIHHDSWKYKLEKSFNQEMAEKLALSATYGDSCTSAIFSFEKRYRNLGISEPLNTLEFRLQFKTF